MTEKGRRNNSKNSTKRLLGVVVFILGIAYPVIVFLSLVVFKLPVRLIALCVVLFGFVLLMGGKDSKSSVIKALVILLFAFVCVALNSSLLLKFYPVAMNAVLLCIFALSLLRRECIIFKFALLKDKSLATSFNRYLVLQYCKKVCVTWCVFFVCNALIALWTILKATDGVWVVYNGGVSYCLMGLLFAIEYIIRKKVEKNMPKFYPLSQFSADSRSMDTVLCFDGAWSKGVYKTWGDFLLETAVMRHFLSQKPYTKWLLHSEDRWLFLITFVALLQCKKDIYLTANITSGYIGQIRDSSMGFLTDSSIENSDNIAMIINDSSKKRQVEAQLETPAIVRDDTKIYMFTSGTTGKPKVVLQRLTEFEMDNAFVASKWANEFASRKLVSTVSQHHIYGLLFSILLPFALGVPFLRKRIEYPEELMSLNDTSYMIITVPAFLKRTVEMNEKFLLKSPWLFTSGGAVPFDVAKKTNEILGFWPVEIYGSTETSGIAYRKSVDGMEWTCFDNAQIHLNDVGCLVIKSPYIKDPAGFATADMAEILKDGRFRLLGRLDNVVKIEEKRISLAEIETCIMQTRFVKDVCAVPMENEHRQYIAAVIVLNDNGKQKFADVDKFHIDTFFREYLLKFFEPVVLPKRFRYVDTIPLDAQGKKKRLEMQALFNK